MDRNLQNRVGAVAALGVALRKESVDRNKFRFKSTAKWAPSLSARRAWIEIGGYGKMTQEEYVALRKESVDRNLNFMGILCFAQVALRKESVDRNMLP